MAVELFLQLKNISVHYGGIKALNNISLYIDEGEIVALMGPNGAGKSTVLKAIFGLVPADTGEILLHGRLLRPTPLKVVHLGIAYVPQGRRVFFHLTVKENLEMGGFIVQDKEVLRQRIEEVLDLFPDLRPKLNTKAAALSGGQQQMVAIARGLMTGPNLLLLDEPSLGLAPKVVKEVFAKIKEINEKRKTSILVVEHNIRSLFAVVRRAYVLDKGVVVQTGSSQDIITSGILERVFVGGSYHGYKK